MGIFGLVYVGFFRVNSYGGVCLKVYYSLVGKKNIYLNSGLMSIKNYGKIIFIKEVDLVIIYELGYNFGVEYDLDGLVECVLNED